MAGDDVSIAAGGDERKGFNSAVDDFCGLAGGQTVPGGGYLSLATEVFLNGGKDPKVYGLIGYVFCKPFRTFLFPKNMLTGQCS